MQRLAIKLFAPALSAILLGLLMLSFHYGPSLFEEPWLSHARAAHTEWTDSAKITDGQVLDARNYLSGLRQMGPAPHLPDLTGAGLRIEQVSYLPPSPNRAAGARGPAQRLPWPQLTISAPRISSCWPCCRYWQSSFTNCGPVASHPNPACPPFSLPPRRTA